MSGIPKHFKNFHNDIWSSLWLNHFPYSTAGYSDSISKEYRMCQHSSA
uniref:Uncharacterized protein n=1 Tax=Anguilla anguilla TaxID=7936 RepID=A0A0E9PYW5_ANGAN